MNEAVLVCKGLEKTFGAGALQIKVLDALDFKLQAQERVAIVGASGSGKSTLLHLLGGLDKPTKGSIEIAGQNINHLPEIKRCQLRNRYLGFVYQFHHLLPEFNVLENVCMPLLIRNTSPDQARAKALPLLEKIGLKTRLLHKLSELSGGERQRTAIARALVTEPLCLLADEPTGNLDKSTAYTVYQIMLELNRTFGTSLVIVTHDMHLAERMDRVLILENGKLQQA